MTPSWVKNNIEMNFREYINGLSDAKLIEEIEYNMDSYVFITNPSNNVTQKYIELKLAL